MGSSGSDPPERKQQLQISKESRKIKKSPLPPSAANARPPIIRYEVEPKIHHVKTPSDFKNLVGRLTCQSSDQPLPSLPSDNSDHDHDHDHPSSSHHPLGILSPTPASLPSAVSPNAFTPPPDPLDELFLAPSPPPSEELSIYDYDWEDPADPFHIIPPINFNNIRLPSPNFNNVPPSSSNFNNNFTFPSPNFYNVPPFSSNFNNNIPFPSPNFNNVPSFSSNYNMPPRPLYYPPKFPDPFN